MTDPSTSNSRLRTLAELKDLSVGLKTMSMLLQASIVDNAIKMLEQLPPEPSASPVAWRRWLSAGKWFYIESEAAPVGDDWHPLYAASIPPLVGAYLKDGETVAECIVRNRRDVSQALGLLAAEKAKTELLQNEVRIWMDANNEWLKANGPGGWIDDLRKASQPPSTFRVARAVEDDDESFMFLDGNDNWTPYPWMAYCFHSLTEAETAATKHGGQVRAGDGNVPPLASTTQPPCAWQPIETADPNVKALLFSPAKNLSSHPDQEDDVRVSAPRDFTWATHWYPLPSKPADSNRCDKDGHIWVGTGDNRIICDECGIEKTR